MERLFVVLRFFMLLKSVKLLLDNGADINIRNQERETPLSCVKRLGENEIVALLLKYGATEDNK